MNVHVCVIKDPQEREKHGGYKYLLTSGAISWSAYRTDKGFEAFLKRGGLKLKKFWSRSSILNKQIEDRYFWKLSDIPNLDECVSYQDLCNGGLVTCYCHATEDTVTIYRPNPNAKRVYNPLPLQAHIEYQRVYG